MKHLNIHTERIKRGWSQVYVGQQINISKVSVHNIETGQRKPSYDVLIKLCKLFNVPHTEVEQLFTVTDNDNLSS